MPKHEILGLVRNELYLGFHFGLLRSGPNPDPKHWLLHITVPSQNRQQTHKININIKITLLNKHILLIVHIVQMPKLLIVHGSIFWRVEPHIVNIKIHRNYKVHQNFCCIFLGGFGLRMSLLRRLLCFTRRCSSPQGNRPGIEPRTLPCCRYASANHLVTPCAWYFLANIEFTLMNKLEHWSWAKHKYRCWAWAYRCFTKSWSKHQCQTGKILHQFLFLKSRTQIDMIYGMCTQTWAWIDKKRSLLINLGTARLKHRDWSK